MLRRRKYCLHSFVLLEPSSRFVSIIIFRITVKKKYIQKINEKFKFIYSIVKTSLQHTIIVTNTERGRTNTPLPVVTICIYLCVCVCISEPAKLMLLIRSPCWAFSFDRKLGEIRMPARIRFGRDWIFVKIVSRLFFLDLTFFNSAKRNTSS